MAREPHGQTPADDKAVYVVLHLLPYAVQPVCHPRMVGVALFIIISRGTTVRVLSCTAQSQSHEAPPTDSHQLAHMARHFPMRYSALAPSFLPLLCPAQCPAQCLVEVGSGPCIPCHSSGRRTKGYTRQCAETAGVQEPHSVVKHQLLTQVRILPWTESVLGLRAPKREHEHPLQRAAHRQRPPLSPIISPSPHQCPRFLWSGQKKLESFLTGPNQASLPSRNLQALRALVPSI